MGLRRLLFFTTLALIESAFSYTHHATHVHNVDPSWTASLHGASHAAQRTLTSADASATVKITKDEAIQAAQAAKTKNLDCTALDMCSKGKVLPFSGDVFPSAGLKESVAARSYKGELILVGESRLHPFLQVGHWHAMISTPCNPYTMM